MNHKVRVKSVIGIIVILCGGAIIAGFDYSFAGSNTYGNIAAFLAAVFFGGYFLIGQHMRDKIPFLNYIFLVFGACFLFFAAAMLITRTPFTGYRIEDYLWILAMMILCQAMSHMLFNFCVRHAPPLYVSVWASIDVVFTTSLGIICFYEIPTAWQFIGGIIAISGLLYYNYNEVKNDV
jgi:drug/metabolite transporter (DMT)-like permease